MDVILQRPASNFRYNKSHVQRQPVPLLQLYSEFGMNLQYLGELYADTVGAPGQLLCPQSPSKACSSCQFLMELNGTRELGRKFWQLGTRAVFHRLDECCAFPPRTSPWSEEMPCFRYLLLWRKSTVAGWSCPGGRAGGVSWHWHSLEGMDTTLPGSVLVERTQKRDKAGQTCSLCWDFWRFFSLGKEEAIVVFGWSSVVVLSRYCVLLHEHLVPGSASFFLVPNEGQHCSSQASASTHSQAELEINPGHSWHSGIGILTWEQANGLRLPWGIGCAHPVARDTSQCSLLPAWSWAKQPVLSACVEPMFVCGCVQMSMGVWMCMDVCSLRITSHILQGLLSQAVQAGTGHLGIKGFGVLG